MEGQRFVESVITALGLVSKRGRAFEKCCKKARRSLTFDSEVWRSRIQEHTIIKLPLLPKTKTCNTAFKTFGHGFMTQLLKFDTLGYLVSYDSIS